MSKAKTKVIATLKSDDDISIIIEIEDNFTEDNDDGRIGAALNKLRYSTLTGFQFWDEFRNKFSFIFE